MEKRQLKNPRARRMLNLIQHLDTNKGNNDLTKNQTSVRHSAKTRKRCVSQTDEDKTESCDLRENHSSEYTTSLVKAGEVNIDQELVTPSVIIKSTKKKQSYELRDVKKQDYDERDKDNEDFSTDASSEYLPSPNRKIQTPSSTSSFGGDSACIEKLIETNNKLWSPSVISNISFVLDNDVDFIASPTAIYKNDCVGAPIVILEQHTDNNSNLLYSKRPSLTPPCQEHQVKENSGDETLKSNDGDKTLNLNETLVENSLSVDIATETMHVIQSPFPCAEIDQIRVSTTGIICELSDCQDIELLQEVAQSNDTHMVQSNEIMSSSDQENLQAENLPNNEQFEPSVTQNKKKSRKRTRNMDEWKDKKNKAMKNSGKSYEGVRTKKTFDAKTIGPACTCNKNCAAKFTMEQRESIFQTFYKLGNREHQWQYIVRHTDVQPIKRVTLDRKNNRTQTIKYLFPLDGLNINVCKTYFLNTIRVSEQTVYTALEKIKRDETLIDKRGTHKNRPHKMSDSTKESVMTHIKIFPAVESHYVRKDTKRLYLSEHLNISKMYRLYELWFPNQHYSAEHKATKRHYEYTFNTEFNYSFFKPKKDLCGICSQYDQANEITKISLETKYREHLMRKNKVRQLKEEEKAAVDERSTTIAIFDLEKVLSIPQSEVGIFHYKRKYPVYNFTVYDSLRKLGHCFVWHLSIAKRGSIEIGSCLIKFIELEGLQGIKNLSFYSDGCAVQNKNRYIFALYLYALRAYDLQNITHRFFETGHGQNEGDSMHSCIERAMKNKVLYTPDQVYSIIMNAKVTGKKYKVHEMKQRDFYDIKSLICGKNWLKDTQGNKIKWAKIMEVKVSYLKPKILQFKYNFEEEEYLELDTELQITRPRRGRRPTASIATEAESLCLDLKQAYNQQIPLSKALHADLISLCTSDAIPQHYHAFYDSLTSCEANPSELSDSEVSESVDDEE